MTMMTPEVYEDKRNNLVQIIDGILKSCGSFNSKTHDNLLAILDKLQSNSFEIVLIGEFQGGKSTTFDAICDGREISPRGIGIKTSACKISATSLPPEEQDEYALLHWKSDKELLYTMYGIIRSHIIDDSVKLNLFEKADPAAQTHSDGEHDNELATIDLIADLRDQEIFDIAEECIRKEWELFEANKAAYDHDNKGRLDLLQTATLILKFFNDKALVALRQKKRIPVEDIKTLVAFPQDWCPRWNSCRQEIDFRFEEVNFIFLSEASCFIDSPNLRRLGCTIVDCPGLFAGPWDTMIARSAMRRADAILYLIGGGRAITFHDILALREIKTNQQEHKLFYAINARQPKSVVDAAFRQNDFSAIQQAGLQLRSADDISVFHARLAFNAIAQLEDNVKNQVRRDLKRDICDYFSLDSDDDRKHIDAYLEARAALKRDSGFDALISKIETDIVTRKFKDVLWTNGLNCVVLELNKLNGALAVKEKYALSNKEHAEEEETLARVDLDNFEERSMALVNAKLGDPNVAAMLVENFRNDVILANLPQMADKITAGLINQLADTASRSEHVKEWLKGKKSDVTSQIIEKTVATSFIDVLNPAMLGWLTNIRQGQNITFNSTYGDRLSEIESKLKIEWKEYEGGQALLNGLPLSITYVPSDAQRGIHTDCQEKLYNVLGSVITASFAKMIYLKIVATIVPLLLGAVSFVFFKPFFSNLEKKILLQVYQDLLPKIKGALSEYFNSEEGKKTLKIHSKDIVDRIVDSMKNVCYGSFGRMRDALNERINERVRERNNMNIDWANIADECLRVRRDEITQQARIIFLYYNGLMRYISEPGAINDTDLRKLNDDLLSMNFIQTSLLEK